MKPLFPILLLLCLALVGRGQDTCLTNKIWVCNEWTSSQFSESQKLFALYLFRENGVLEVHPENFEWEWSFSKHQNHIVVEILDEQEKFEYSILMYNEDSMILYTRSDELLEDTLYFFSLPLRNQVYNCDWDSVFPTKYFYSLKADSGYLKLKADFSIEEAFNTPDFILADKTWSVFSFNNYYFLVLRPDIFALRIELNKSPHKEIMLIPLHKSYLGILTEGPEPIKKKQ